MHTLSQTKAIYLVDVLNIVSPEK